MNLEHIEKPVPVVVEVVAKVVDENAINIVEKLVATPDSEYEVTLGKANKVELG